jgi:hypothetical protein
LDNYYQLVLRRSIEKPTFVVLERAKVVVLSGLVRGRRLSSKNNISKAFLNHATILDKFNTLETIVKSQRHDLVHIPRYFISLAHSLQDTITLEFVISVEAKKFTGGMFAVFAVFDDEMY